MGDALLVILPALILAAVLWAGVTALKPRDFGISDAERYQLELAARSQAHDAAQAKAAMAARARLDAAARPSQNKQQQAERVRAAPYSSGSSGPAARRPEGGHRALHGGGPDPQPALQPLVRNGQKDHAAGPLRQVTHTDFLTPKNYVDRL